MKRIEGMIKNRSNIKLIIVISAIVSIFIVLFIFSLIHNNKQLKNMKKISKKYYAENKLEKEVGTTNNKSKFNLNNAYYIKYPSFKYDNMNEVVSRTIKDIIDYENKKISTSFQELTHNLYTYNIVDYESYMGPDGVIGISFINTIINSKNKVIREYVYSINLSIDENDLLNDTYVFVGDYKSVIKEYVENYLKSDEKISKKLKKNYKKSINKYNYIVNKKGITLYYNSNEIIKGNKVFKINIPYEDLNEVINIDVDNKIDYKDLKKNKEKYKKNKKEMYISKLTNLYAEGSKNSDVISTIEKGNKVSVIESSKTYSKIKYNDKKGYIINKSLSDDIIADAGYSDTKEEVYAIEEVVVRKGIEDDSEELVTLAFGDSILRIGTSDNGFSEVVYNGEKGFVKSSYLSLTKPSLETVPNIDKTRNVNSHGGMVALTFDDGPSPSSTNRILDTLEKYHAVATFFDLGSLVLAHPDVVKREESIGCEVGSHTYSHKNLNNLGAEGIQAEVNSSKDAFVSVLGHDVSLLRPPYGNANDLVRANIPYPIINWNVDTLDWKTKNKDSIINEVRKIGNLDGKIVLMHSIYPSTADAVEILVPELINQGYQLVTVSELAYYKGVSLSAGVKYYGF